MTKAKHESAPLQAPQVEKFRQLAREIGADEDPDAFKAKLVKIAKAPRPPKPEAK